MNWKKLGKYLLFPHIAIVITLIPLSATLLVFALAFLGSDSVVSYMIFALAFYSLLILCARIPNFIKWYKKFKGTNQFAIRWGSDEKLRLRVSLYLSLILNIAYAIFQLWLGFFNKTLWFTMFGIYYSCLALMRFFLLSHIKRYIAGERYDLEIKKYRTCGWIFLFMNISIAFILFFMVYFDRSFEYGEITVIALAAYTFTSLTLAIISVVRYKKYNSPVYSASKFISLASAVVSMLTLEASMLSTFSGGSDGNFEKIILTLSGSAISIFIIALAAYMIAKGTKKIKNEEQYGKQE